MPSFDIVSRLDLAEIDNAIAGIDREIATRFDFKGSKCEIKRDDGALALVADDDLPKPDARSTLLKVPSGGIAARSIRRRLSSRRRKRPAAARSASRLPCVRGSTPIWRVSRWRGIKDPAN